MKEDQQDPLNSPGEDSLKPVHAKNLAEEGRPTWENPSFAAELSKIHAHFGSQLALVSEEARGGVLKDYIIELVRAYVEPAFKKIESPQKADQFLALLDFARACVKQTYHDVRGDKEMDIAAELADAEVWRWRSEAYTRAALLAAFEPRNPIGDAADGVSIPAEEKLANSLTELFEQLNPEAQALIRAAEAQAEARLARGKSEVRDRMRGPGSSNDRDWVLEPQDQARADAACQLFVAYGVVLYKRADLSRREPIEEYLALLGRVRDWILAEYGRWEGETAIRELQASLEHRAWLTHSQILESANLVAAAPSKVGSAADLPRSPYRPPPNKRDADFWRDRRLAFDNLASRQRSILGHQPHDEHLKAYCHFSDEPGNVGQHRISGGFDGRLLSDFEEVATRAACAFELPPTVEPVDFWIDCLSQDLLNASKPQIRRELSPRWDGGGIIQGLLESSAGFCSRLATQAERESSDSRVRSAFPSQISSAQTPSVLPSREVSQPFERSIRFPDVGDMRGQPELQADLDGGKLTDEPVPGWDEGNGSVRGEGQEDETIIQADIFHEIQPKRRPAILADATDATLEVTPDYSSERERLRAIAAYVAGWDHCSEASLARTAKVDPADLSKWKKGSLPPGSDKKARVENVLRNNNPPTPAPKRH